MIKKSIMLLAALIMLTGFASAANGVMTQDSDDFYMIEDEADLLAMVTDLSADYKLANDITLTRPYVTPRPNSTINADFFKGTFDGNNFSINNFTVSGGRNNVGLFASLDNATVKNLNLNDVVISNPNYNFVGAVAGAANGICTIENVHVETKAGSLGAIKGNASVSGLIGDMMNVPSGPTVLIKDCSFTGTIEAINVTGSMTSRLNNKSTVTNCSFSGEITSFMYAGGLVGNHYGIIEKSKSEGSVIGKGAAGGIAGNSYAGSEISECYSNVSAYATIVGGITGSIRGGVIDNCFSTGMLSATSIASGIAGEAENSEIKNCYSTDVIYSQNSAWGIARSFSSVISNCLALNEYITAPYVYRISNGPTTDSYSWEYITNNGSQVEMNGTEISKEVFWDTYNKEGNTIWETWSGDIWTLNTNQNFLLPVLISSGGEADGDMNWFDYQPDGPQIIYKTVGGGGSDSGSVRIVETEVVTETRVEYVESTTPGIGMGEDLPEDNAVNIWFIISMILAALVILMTFACWELRKNKEIEAP